MAEINKIYAEDTEEKIDIISGMVRGWKMFKRTWWLLILLVAAGAVISLAYIRFAYTPEYEASASFSVSSGSGGQTSSYTQNISMAQLSATFPYILESGALEKVICEDLGVESLGGTITATVVEDTSLFQIKVTSEDAQRASDILESVIENYPTVARFIIGDTTLTMLDNTGVPTKPSNPVSRRQALLVGGLTACLIYLVILVLLTAARRTVNSEEDLKRYSSLRCLASIPKTYLKKRSRRKQQLMLIDQKVTPSFIEAVSTLRIRVLRELKKNKEQVVLVTSASENEGKTTIASNLALSLAKKGYQTLLIDGDLRNPSIGRQFGLTAAAGIADVLTEKAQLRETIIRYGETKLDILPGHQPAGNHKVAALLGSDRMTDVMDSCRSLYDYVVIDTPPCSMMQDAAALARLSDCALTVIRQDYIAISRILGSMELLTETDIRLLGYVINSEDTGIGSYGYGRYGYGKYGYGKYGKYQYGYGKKPSTKDKVQSEEQK